MLDGKEYKAQELIKFSPETWITYWDVFAMGTLFTHKIKNIPECHLVSRFYLTPEKDYTLYEKYNLK